MHHTHTHSFLHTLSYVLSPSYSLFHTQPFILIIMDGEYRLWVGEKYIHTFIFVVWICLSLFTELYLTPCCGTLFNDHVVLTAWMCGWFGVSYTPFRPRSPFLLSLSLVSYCWGGNVIVVIVESEWMCMCVSSKVWQIALAYRYTRYLIHPSSGIWTLSNHEYGGSSVQYGMSVLI